MCDQKLDIATVGAEADSKSLTNIYYDCLERIFDFLDLEDLMNVAGTCKRLQIAAAAKFADDYGHAHVSLDNNNNSIQYVASSLPSLIHVSGLKFCLTFLRCFGAKILNLFVDQMIGTPNRYRYVSQYINQYCADTVISICFWSRSSFSSEVFIKPFKAVKKLVLWGGKLGDQLPNFVDWFPNLHHFALMNSISIDDSAIAVSFPYLEFLNIEIDKNGLSQFTTEGAIKFLHANQQLQLLDICMPTKFDKLLDMICANKSILKLRVHGGITDVNDVQLNRLANEHQLLEELHFDGLKVDDAIALIRQLKSLKRFQFRVKDQTKCDRFVSQLESKWEHHITPYQDCIYVIINRE